MALGRSLDQLAARERLFAQGDVFLRASIAFRRRWQAIFDWTGRRIVSAKTCGKQRNRQPAQNTLHHLLPPSSAQLPCKHCRLREYEMSYSVKNPLGEE